MKNQTYSRPDFCPYCHSARVAVDYIDATFACYTRISFALQYTKRTLKCIAIEHARTKAA